jgi:2-phosphosulfolactate phosphatase
MPAEAVLVSENAPKTLALLESAEHLLLASLYNADAAAQRALELAKERIFLVACGLWEQEDLDDAIALAYLAAKLKQLKPEIHLEGASWFCINLLKAFPDPLEALWRSSAGHFLRKLNQEDDLAIASLVSQSAHVPERMGSQEQDGTVIYTFRSQIS